MITCKVCGDEVFEDEAEEDICMHCWDELHDEWVELDLPRAKPVQVVIARAEYL